MSDNEFMDMVSDLKEEFEPQKALDELESKILSTFDLGEILNDITEKTCKILECDRATVYVVERGEGEESRELVSRSMIGEELNEIRLPYNLRSIAGAVACSGRLIRIRDVYDTEELLSITPNPSFDHSWDEKTGYKTKSMLVAPARKSDYIIGVIQAINKKEDEFSKEDEKLMCQIADLLSSALTSERGHTKTVRKRRKTMNTLLIEKELITEEKLQQAAQKAKSEKIKLLDILIKEYDIPEDEITKCLAEFNDVDFIDFDPDTSIDPTLFDDLTEEYSKQHLICPLKQTMAKDGSMTLQLVMHNPKDFVAIEDVEIRTNAKISKIFMATRSDILAMIRHCLHPSQSSSGGMVEEDAESMGDLITELSEELGIEEQEEVESVNIQEGTTEEEGPIVKLSNRIIEEAVRRGATDIHIEPYENMVLVRYRIDGSLEKSLTFPHHAKNAIVSRYKIMAECNITEHRIPQDGRIAFKKFGGKYDIELRVNFLPTVGENEDIVMRILADSKPMPLENMGLYPYSLEPMLESIQKPYGMILCVGPTGSGKTTTLHSAVSYINTPERKILTAEDPVEITQDGLRQVQVKKNVGLTFAAALRAFLRQDPDVILVGEMRDLETCAIAVEAALTGHLLLSTLHTNNAPETVTRLVDIGIDPVTLSDALLLVLAQRLAKTLCKSCKEQYDPTDEELEEANIQRSSDGKIVYLGEEYPEAEFYKPVGCSTCENRQYKGRMGLHEALHNIDDIKRLIATSGKIEDIRDAAKANGMKELYEDGIIKVLSGKTSIHQIRAVCTE
ncbi:MAG: GspE/PulE family protein [Planctomycetota bacterium]|jgi:type II secretory ATPase GspE/PulE/Tfp pilus assembly ATPase PilB-like protein